MNAIPSFPFFCRSHHAGMLLQCRMMSNTCYFEKRMVKGRMVVISDWIQFLHCVLKGSCVLRGSARDQRISYERTI